LRQVVLSSPSAPDLQAAHVEAHSPLFMAIFLIFALNTLVWVGINASRILFSLYALNLGATSAGVGGIMAMFYVFPLLLSWPIGVLSDRFGTRWFLAGATAAGVCGMLIPYLAPSLWSLYVAAGMLGLTLAFNSVMGQNLVGVLSKPQERTRNFTNYSLTGSISIFAGPLFAGFAIDTIGYPLTCLAIAVLFLLGVALLAVWGKVLPRSQRRVKPGGSLLHTLMDRRLWRMLSLSSLSQLGNDLFQTFLPIYAHGIGLTASVIGSLLSALAVASFGVRLAMLRLIALMGEHKLMAIAFYLGAGAFMLVPLSHGAGTLAVLAFVFGMAQGCTQPLTMILMFSSAEEGHAGEAVGLRMTVNNAARILGPAAFGAIGAVTGLSAVFWINGTLMAIGGRLSAPKKGRKHSSL